MFDKRKAKEKSKIQNCFQGDLNRSSFRTTSAINLEETMLRWMLFLESAAWRPQNKLTIYIDNKAIRFMLDFIISFKVAIHRIIVKKQKKFAKSVKHEQK